MDFFLGELLGGDSHVGERAQRPILLLGRQPADHVCHLLALDRVDLVEDLATSVRDADLDDAPVVLGTSPLDETSLDHSLDDPGHVGQRNVELIGQPAHRHRAAAHEHVQHVQVR